MNRRKADNFELEGVRITNGRSQGAGILISTEDDSYAIIKDTLFNLNAGPRGGAISVAKGNLILENVVIRDNYTASSGGGAIKFNESSDQENTNPLLRLLSNNGGPTMTMALLDVSPAIDAGLIAVCSQTASEAIYGRLTVTPAAHENVTMALSSLGICPSSQAYHSSLDDS
jgi:hypothetical protein